jgi:hypothetical protein
MSAIAKRGRCPKCGEVWTEFMEWYDGPHCQENAASQTKTASGTRPTLPPTGMGEADKEPSAVAAPKSGKPQFKT